MKPIYLGFSARLAHLLRKYQIRYVALTVLAVALMSWAAQHWHASQLPPSGMWVSIEAQPLERPITAEGPLAEASAVSIVAPFDGAIVQRWVRPGDHVEAGAPLLQLDTSAVQAELREAQAAHIRAQEDLAGLVNWKTSADVTAAQRQVVNTHRQMQVAQARLTDTQTLFDKGIVARAEVESAQSEVSSATEQWQNASDGLASTLRKGGAAQQQIARLEAESRSVKVRLLQERLTRATLTAPVAGVVLKPTPTEGAPAKELDVGSFVSSRAVLMTIGDNTHYVVRAALDEFDAVRVKPDIPVKVMLSTDETAIMGGVLTRVSAQARNDQRFGASGAPMFDIEVLVRDVPQELRPRLRLGMTTRLRMVVEKQSAAVVVPLAAVRMDATGRAFVTRRAAGEATGPGNEVGIETGITLVDRVFVAKGLAVGDSVWVPLSAQSETVPSRDMSQEANESTTTLPFGLSGQR
ncbi:MAG: hypothetical protein RLZZ573_1145 [Pseudomonadota bacterium]